jgi:hypothetical protein
VVVAGQLGGLELRHRQHARVEDRIREAKATGLANLPCHRFDANAAWLQIVLAATDLVSWSKLVGFADQPDLANCESDTFRYRALHVAARTTRRPTDPVAHRRHLAMGHRHLPRMATTPEPPPHNRSAAVHPDPRNPLARRPSDTGRLVIPIRQNQPHTPDGTGSTPYEQAARKIEVKAL